MKVVLLACSVAAVVAVAGCATAQPPHRWGTLSKTNHIPMQGLAAKPRIVLQDGPVSLVNFSDEHERQSKRQIGMEAGAIRGATEATIVMMAKIAPVCLVFPPICIGMAGVGAAIGSNQATVSTIPQQQADRLAPLFSTDGTNVTFSKYVDTRLGGNPGQYPYLVIRPISVILIPAKYGVTFRVVAEAQAFSSSEEKWEPSYPSRSFLRTLRRNGSMRMGRR